VSGALRVVALKGPTGMGLAGLLAQTPPRYRITITASPSEAMRLLADGQADAALVPANLAVGNVGGAEVRVAAVTTLGTLCLVEVGNTIHELADIRGTMILNSGRRTTPQQVTDRVLHEAGLAGAVDVRYLEGHGDVASALSAGRATLGILPEPFVSVVLAANPAARVALDLSREWERVAGCRLVMGVLAVRDDVARARPLALDAFLDDYAASVAFVNAHPADAAQVIAAAGIVPDARVAQSAIPRCRIVALTGQDAQGALSGFLEAKANQPPRPHDAKTGPADVREAGFGLMSR